MPPKKTIVPRAAL
jgi:hypothetical protein